jgi:hypothetical protein
LVAAVQRGDQPLELDGRQRVDVLLGCGRYLAQRADGVGGYVPVLDGAGPLGGIG